MNLNYFLLSYSEVNHDKNSISRKMRWATIGYHHNWDTKVRFLIISHSNALVSDTPSTTSYRINADTLIRKW